MPDIFVQRVIQGRFTILHLYLVLQKLPLTPRLNNVEKKIG